MRQPRQAPMISDTLKKKLTFLSNKMPYIVILLENLANHE